MQKKKNLLFNKIGLLVCLIIYRLMLDWIYFNVICLEFSYEGYVDNRTFELQMISWICLLISICFITKVVNNKTDRISSIVIVTLYVISYIPFSTCIYAGLFSDGFIFANNVYWLLLIFAERISLKRRIKPFKRIKIGRFRIDDRFVKIVGVFSFLLVMFISAKYTHFRLNFNMFNVYDLRNEASTYNFPTVIAYMFDWTKAINPILLAYCLLKKKYFMSALFFLSQMFSFGIDGLKSTFFLPFVVIWCVFFYNKFSERVMRYIICYGLTGVAFLAIIEKISMRSFFIIQLFIRRMEFTTNYISSCYYEFFTKNPPDYFRSSFLRYFGFVSPYTSNGKSIGEVIASNYFRNGVNFNNGLISDACANLGWVGIICMPIIVIVVLRIFDKSTEGLDKRLTIATALYISLVILSSFMATVLLTHGLLVLILLLSMMDRENEKIK